RIRTLIARSRVWRPAIRRSPIASPTARGPKISISAPSPVKPIVFVRDSGTVGAMELSFWAATDVGRKREVNEDNFLVDKKLSLFIVADGMGGHASGEVASHLAVHELRNTVEAGTALVQRHVRA